MVGKDPGLEELLEQRTRQLQASEARFRNIVTTSADGIVIVDGLGMILFVNPAAEALFNLKAEELQGVQFGFPISADKTTDVDIINQGGTHKIVEMVVVTTEWEGETAYLATMRDISERRRSELELRKLFRAVTQCSCMVMITDARAAIEYVNPKFSEVTGYTPLEVLGQNPRLLKSELTAPEIYAKLWEALTAGKEWQGQFTNRKKNGEIYYEAASIAPITDPEGTVTHFVAVMEDITERKRAEEALRESEALFRVIFDQALHLMGLLSPDGTLLKVNQAAAALLESGTEELIGRYFWDTPWWSHPPEQRERLRAAVQAAARGEIARFEATHRTPEGEVVWVDFSLKPVMDEEGNVMLLVPEGRDITESKRASVEIEKLNRSLAARVAELEETNQELEAFNRIVSHDLRQPLNSIGLCCQAVEMMCGASLGDDGKKNLGYVRYGVARMNALIDSLLTFSRTTHQKVRRELFDISEVARSVMEGLRVSDPGRRVAFTCPERVMANGDPELLRAVLENLIGNAWKFTGSREEGAIEFGARETDKLPVYFVRDNGNGFNAAEADQLFVPFSRLSGSEGFTGTGIGLATADRIIRRHGGRIWGEGEPGQGASFYFTLDSPPKE